MLKMFSEKCVIKTIKHSPKLLFWSEISDYGLGHLRILEENIKQDQYEEFLETISMPHTNNVPWKIKEGLQNISSFSISFSKNVLLLFLPIHIMFEKK